GWSLYGMKCCAFIFSERSLFVYKIIFPLFTTAGAVLDASLVWQVGEAANGIMALPNLTALIMLAPVVKKLTVCYTLSYDKQSKRKHNRNKKHGASVAFGALRCKADRR
ncbi:MAG: alanine:cation symporter family protein, partial [Clostridia bacterium]|nr:alanine:cation symporter family protein [Clostridia bacterium]